MKLDVRRVGAGAICKLTCSIQVPQQPRDNQAIHPIRAGESLAKRLSGVELLSMAVVQVFKESLASAAEQEGDK